MTLAAWSSKVDDVGQSAASVSDLEAHGIEAPSCEGAERL